MRRRGPLALLVVAAALVAVLLVWSQRDASRDEGPLAPGVHTTVGAPMMEPGVAFTWGEALPVNDTASPITLVAVAPVDVSGVEVLGILAAPAGGLSIGLAAGFPPGGVETRPVEGARVEPGPGNALQLLLHVELGAGEAHGSIGALRVTYDYQGERHEVVLPRSLEAGP